MNYQVQSQGFALEAPGQDKMQNQKWIWIQIATNLLVCIPLFSQTFVTWNFSIPVFFWDVSAETCTEIKQPVWSQILLYFWNEILKQKKNGYRFTVVNGTSYLLVIGYI